jgi:hypothetical protein
MKYYETTFEEYIHSCSEYNIHPELDKYISSFPDSIYDMKQMIIYGPTGVGKYTQTLRILEKYSPSKLKYEKKITAVTDKQSYQYKISDIHYEIDMSMLGCYSKTLWHEIFSQVIDIISVKPSKVGIIVCKNFHMIHSELLETFYSYIQQYNHNQTTIIVKFILITDHISFIPNKILDVCNVVKVERPSKEKYSTIATTNLKNFTTPLDNESILNRVSKPRQIVDNAKKKNIIGLVKSIDVSGITNTKELRSFDLLFSNNNQTQILPDDNFNIVCNKIIEAIIIEKDVDYLSLRDTLYDILTYNLDTIECIWYILSYLIHNMHLDKKDISDICINMYSFLKYYNNNYRPIYHLESIFYYITNKVRGFHEL